MNTFVNYVGYIVIGLFVFFFPPIAINFLISLTCPFDCSIIGSNIEWLQFYGSYIGGVVAASSAFIVLYFTLQKDKKKQIRQQKLDELDNFKYNFSRRLSSFDFLDICYSVDLNLQIIKSQEKNRVNTLVSKVVVNYRELRLLYFTDRECSDLLEIYSKQVRRFEEHSSKYFSLLSKYWPESNKFFSCVSQFKEGFWADYENLCSDINRSMEEQNVLWEKVESIIKAKQKEIDNL